MARMIIKENAEFIAEWDPAEDLLHVSSQPVYDRDGVELKGAELIETLDLTTPEAQAKGNFLAEAITEAVKRAQGVTLARGGDDGADGADTGGLS